ncbi:MAG: helix-turn-helix domain-containing protein [Caldilineaceae bacterium]
MNIEDHPAFKELADAVRQLSVDRQQELDYLLRNPTTSLLTVYDVAQIMAVHERTVRRWIQLGQLRATRLPRYRIHPLELARFLEARQVKSA